MPKTFKQEFSDEEVARVLEIADMEPRVEEDATPEPDAKRFNRVCKQALRRQLSIQYGRAQQAKIEAMSNKGASFFPD